MKPKGLYNPSVYCFLNTCLQCLLSIPELTYYFNEKLYLQEKKKKGLSACEAMNSFISTYNESDYKIKPPANMYKLCHSFLQANEQHDCQEFLRRLLMSIQDELCVNNKYNFPENASLEKVWLIYREKYPSFIDSLFTGLIKSTVICHECKYQSNTYDPFMDLSVAVGKQKECTIEECLKVFFSSEEIDCKYKCTKCKRITPVNI